MAVRALLHYALDVPDRGAGEKFSTRPGFHHGSFQVGSVDEIAIDLDYIAEHCAWEARVFPPEDALYRWVLPCPTTSDSTANWRTDHELSSRLRQPGLPWPR